MGDIAVKAYIYAEDGALLGYIACTEAPPDVLELGGRYFRHKGVFKEENVGEFEILSHDYWEIEVENEVEFIPICMACGRNSSMMWHKCCTEHCTLEGPEVFCQSCVEILHPNDPEFERE